MDFITLSIHIVNGLIWLCLIGCYFLTAMMVQESGDKWLFQFLNTLLVIVMVIMIMK